MSSSDIIKDNIAPLVQRILSDPLQFKPAKHPEVVTNRPSSYIRIGGTSEKSIPSEEEIRKSIKSQKVDTEMARARPTSLAQALASYTNKRTNTSPLDNGKKVKKSKKSHFRESLDASSIPQSPIQTESADDLGESLGEESDDEEDEEEEKEEEEEDEEEAANFETTEPETTAVVEDSSSDDESNYTDADGGSPETPHNIGSTRLLNQRNTEDRDSRGNTTHVEETEDEEEEEDDDYVENANRTNSESEDTSTDVEESSSNETHDRARNSVKKDESDSDDPETLKKDLLDDRDPLAPGTPPTTPETDEEKDLYQGHSAKQPTYALENFYQIDENANDRGSNKSSRILKNWGNALSKSKPCGLLNHGVTCYTNAAVQAMVHIPAVQHYLEDVLANKYKQTINPRSVTHVLAETSARMWDRTKKVKYINPKKLIGRLEDINCMMSEWQQEDSHEYFMSLLSRLQEDGTPKGHKLNESIIYDIFGGLLNQSVTCKSCGHVSRTEQEFYDLSLHLGTGRKNSVPVEASSQNGAAWASSTVPLLEDELPKGQRYSIIKSIKEFFSPELIKTDRSDKSGYVCEKCKNRTNAIKISSIARAPETLAVHLKRFRFNGNSSSKVKQGVSYPSILDLSQYTTNGDAALYQLVSVVVHEGRSVSSGHYVAHCRQPDGSWATYDDEYINSITEKQALRDPSAYYLIYTRLTHKDIKISESGELKSSKRFKEASPSPSPSPSSSASPTTSEKEASTPLSTADSDSKKSFISKNQRGKMSILRPKSPKKKIGGLLPTNNLGNISANKKSLKRYAKINPKNPTSRRFKKY